MVHSRNPNLPVQSPSRPRVERAKSPALPLGNAEDRRIRMLERATANTPMNSTEIWYYRTPAPEENQRDFSTAPD
eukprot:COSAG02_NODE_2360_length_9063_cov_19.715529_11_plen_75_part_00